MDSKREMIVSDLFTKRGKMSHDQGICTLTYVPIAHNGNWKRIINKRYTSIIYTLLLIDFTQVWC